MLENKKDMDERNAQTRYPDSVTMNKLYSVSKQWLEISFICQVFFLSGTPAILSPIDPK